MVIEEINFEFSMCVCGCECVKIFFFRVNANEVTAMILNETYTRNVQGIILQLGWIGIMVISDSSCQ